MYKNIKAATEAIASQYFDDIQLLHNIKDDTLFVSIHINNSNPNVEYACCLSLEIPYQMICLIHDILNGVTVSDLDTTLIVKDLNDDIEVIRQNGSCDLNTCKGDLSIETAIPDSGYCRGYSASGNIHLKIPGTTSATIVAYSHEGTVSYTNLDLEILYHKADSLSARSGSGNGEICLETEKGNIEMVGF